MSSFTVSLSRDITGTDSLCVCAQRKKHPHVRQGKPALLGHTGRQGSTVLNRKRRIFPPAEHSITQERKRWNQQTSAKLQGCRGAHHLKRDITASAASSRPQMKSAAANASAQDSLHGRP